MWYYYSIYSCWIFAALLGLYGPGRVRGVDDCCFPAMFTILDFEILTSRFRFGLRDCVGSWVLRVGKILGDKKPDTAAETRKKFV